MNPSLKSDTSMSDPSPKMSNFRFRRTLGQAMLGICLGLVACGGGSSGGGTTTPVSAPGTAVAFLDSFGRDVSGGNDFGQGDAGADGTAGDGAPIANGAVKITDAAGKTATATTDATGYFRIKVNGFTPPLVAQVTKANGDVRYSLNVKPIQSNKFVTVNITGLTDKIASDVAIAGGKKSSAELTPQIVSANSSAIAKSISDISAQFSVVISKAGLKADATFDPLNTPFIANRTGYDNVLDNTVLTKNSSGATVLAVAPVYVAPVSAVPVTAPSTLAVLPGTWTYIGDVSIKNWIVDGVSQPDTNIPGTPTLVAASQVPPSQAALTDFYWLSKTLDDGFAAAQASSPAGFSYKAAYSNLKILVNGFSYDVASTATGTANSVTVTITSTGSFSTIYSDFVDCGPCQIGNSVLLTSTTTYSTKSTTTFSASNTATTSTSSSQQIAKMKFTRTK